MPQANERNALRFRVDAGNRVGPGSRPGEVSQGVERLASGAESARMRGDACGGEALIRPFQCVPDPQQGTCRTWGAITTHMSKPTQNRAEADGEFRPVNASSRRRSERPWSASRNSPSPHTAIWRTARHFAGGKSDSASLSDRVDATFRRTGVAAAMIPPATRPGAKTGARVVAAHGRVSVVRRPAENRMRHSKCSPRRGLHPFFRPR